jgi:anti-anti-sigma factor
MSAFELEPQETGDDHVLHVDVAGELDLTNVPEFEERLGELELGELEQGAESALVLDLNRVVFIDSAALHALFRISRRLGRERFGIVLASTAPIARTLAIVGLPQAVATGDSAETVLAAMRS